jgi:hypothetical protein
MAFAYPFSNDLQHIVISTLVSRFNSWNLKGKSYPAWYCICLIECCGAKYARPTPHAY